MGLFEAVKNVTFGKTWGFFPLCAPVSLCNLSSFTQARIGHFYCCCMLNKEKPHCPTLLHSICCFFTEGNWGSVVAFACLSANTVSAVLYLPKPALVILCSSAFFLQTVLWLVVESTSWQSWLLVLICWPQTDDWVCQQGPANRALINKRITKS